MMRVAEGLGALVAGHAFFTGVGLANATLARAPPRPAATPTSAKARQLASTVKQMYSGGGITAAALADNVSFIDPAASCHGRSEVMEAFRALGAACRPESIEEPMCTKDDGSEVHFHLHQRYFGWLTVRSVLVVQSNTSDGRINHIEERWNGAPLLTFSAFRFVRRVNGIVSAVITARLV